MDYSSFDEAPPYYHRDNEPYYDEGNGIPHINKNNMTIQDVYKTPFLFLQDHHKDYKTQGEEALKGIQMNSDLSREYFSPKNIARIQRRIREEVFRRTKGKYRLDVEQDEKDIFIHMRAVYLEHGKFMPGQIVRQTKRLNEQVVENIVPDMISNIKQYYGYLQDINGPLKPIDRPVNVNNAGRKALPSLTSTFEGLYDF
jgi:cold shock CspA family protein